MKADLTERREREPTQHPLVHSDGGGEKPWSMAKKAKTAMERKQHTKRYLTPNLAVRSDAPIAKKNTRMHIGNYEHRPPLTRPVHVSVPPLSPTYYVLRMLHVSN